jgi:hypothetical protein
VCAAIVRILLIVMEAQVLVLQEYVRAVFVQMGKVMMQVVIPVLAVR